MIPDSIATVLGFLFLIAPGLSYQIHRERRRPALEDTPFREASRVALWSLLLTVGSLLILGLLRWLVPSIIADPWQWLEHGRAYVKDHPRRVGLTLLLQLLLAQGLAWLVAAWAGRHERATIRQGDIWHKVFAIDVPPDRRVQAVVLTKNAEYRGIVAGYTTNADLTNRELQLIEPITFRLRHEPTPRPLPEPFDQVVIAASAIEELWLHHRISVEIPLSWWDRFRPLRFLSDLKHHR